MIDCVLEAGMSSDGVSPLVCDRSDEPQTALLWWMVWRYHQSCHRAGRPRDVSGQSWSFKPGIALSNTEITWLK